MKASAAPASGDAGLGNSAVICGGANWLLSIFEGLANSAARTLETGFDTTVSWLASACARFDGSVRQASPRIISQSSRLVKFQSMLESLENDYETCKHKRSVSRVIASVRYTEDSYATAQWITHQSPGA